jgi:hypothetical protein
MTFTASGRRVAPLTGAPYRDLDGNETGFDTVG